MNHPWSLVLVGAVVIVLFLVLRQSMFVSTRAAQEHLKHGATIIDVRTPQEFQEGHVPGARNVPLQQLPDQMLREVPDKQQVLLLHCLSGGRSAVAKRMLQAQGYTRVYNLGSYSRAKRLAQSASGSR